jgi:uncharacterized protein (TIGR02118 family)
VWQRFAGTGAIGPPRRIGEIFYTTFAISFRISHRYEALLTTQGQQIIPNLRLVIHRILCTTMEASMIKVSVLYPNIAGKTFDMEYYCSQHIPMVQQKLGAACKGVTVEAGLCGAEPGSPATYIAMGHLYFDSVEAFHTAFGPHAQAIMGDIPHYTDLQPTIQISDVKI